MNNFSQSIKARFRPSWLSVACLLSLALALVCLYRLEPSTPALVVLVLYLVAAGFVCLFSMKGMSGLRITAAITGVIGALCFISFLCTQLAPGPLCDASAGTTYLVLTGALVVTPIVGLIWWRRTSGWWIIPFFISAVLYFSVPVTRSLGTSINDYIFRLHLNEYKRVVGEVESGAIRSTPELESINLTNIKSIPSGVIDVWAARLSNGCVYVEFLRSSEGRIHKGYLYRNFKESDAGAGPIIQWDQRFELRHIVGDWYHFSD